LSDVNADARRFADSDGKISGNVQQKTPADNQTSQSIMNKCQRRVMQFPAPVFLRIFCELAETSHYAG
jgi:hypothetical protein